MDRMGRWMEYGGGGKDGWNGRTEAWVGNGLVGGWVVHIHTSWQLAVKFFDSMPFLAAARTFDANAGVTFSFR